MADLYILRLCDGKYYIGCTTDYCKRILDHQSGRSRYTSKYLPIKPVFHQSYPTFNEARRVEIWLKKLKRKEYIEKIIRDGKIRRQNPVG